MKEIERLSVRLSEVASRLNELSGECGGKEYAALFDERMELVRRITQLRRFNENYAGMLAATKQGN